MPQPQALQVPLVSVVMPACDRKQFVIRAVESVLAQSVGDLELIVSDDCSTDGSTEALASFRDPRFTLLTQPSRVGVWKNWTRAIREARGEFIVFLGDDDYLGPTFVEQQVRELRKHPEAAVAYCPYEEIDTEGNPLRRFPTAFAAGELAGPEAYLDAALSMRLFFGAAVFHRRPAVEMWELTEADDLVADVGMTLRLAAWRGSRAVSGTTLAYFKTTHPDQQSSKYFRITQLLKETYLRVRDRTSDLRHRTLLSRSAALETVTLGRHHAAASNLAQARREFRDAIRICPSVTLGWRQLAVSLVAPARLIRTARRQRGLS